ncbi:unnamed protein product [Arctogadus glacialis]
MCASFVRVFRVAITHQCMLSHVAKLLCTCDFSVCGPFRSERSGKKNSCRRRTHATLLLGRALCCCIQGPQCCRGGHSLSKGRWSKRLHEDSLNVRGLLILGVEWSSEKVKGAQTASELL